MTVNKPRCAMQHKSNIILSKLIFDNLMTNKKIFNTFKSQYLKYQLRMILNQLSLIRSHLKYIYIIIKNMFIY